MEVVTNNRPAWDEYFLGIAKVVAQRSTCLRVPDGVGAVLVRDHRILATGYAGSVAKLPHCTEVGCLIENGGCVRTVHAETNALLQAAAHGVSVSDSTAYCTMSPCWVCWKALANAGIKRIVYRDEYRLIDRQREFSALAGIEFVHAPLRL